jgi:hypothetical protein
VPTVPQGAPSQDSQRTAPRARIWIVLGIAVAFVLVGAGLIAATLVSGNRQSSRSVTAVPAPAPVLGGSSSAASATPTPVSSSVSTSSQTFAGRRTKVLRERKSSAPASSKKKKSSTSVAGDSLLPGYNWLLRINGGSHYSSGYLDLQPGIVRLWITVMRTNKRPVIAQWHRYPSAFAPWWTTQAATNGMSGSYTLTVSTPGRYQFAVTGASGTAWALRVMEKGH